MPLSGLLVDVGDARQGIGLLYRYAQMITLAHINAMRYDGITMIMSFRDEESEKVFLRERSRKLPPDVQRIAQRKLVILDAADSLQDLRVPPGNRLESLSGRREGQHSIRVNDRWRVCFRWSDSNAYEVEITDYH